MIAKLEQLGPFTFFYTLSCADRRWDEIFATVVTKKFPNLNVMHVIEENGAKANVLDNENYIPTNNEDIGLDEDELENVDQEEEVEVLDSINIDNDNCQYYIHEKVSRTRMNPNKLCKIHFYANDFICERTNLNNYFEDKQKKELLSGSILDITRMFDHRVKSWIKNILMAPQSVMCIQYYQDKIEFQSRGFPHMHGTGWSDFDKLEDYFPGIKQTFEKVTQRQYLSQEDINPLTDLIKKTVSCSLSAEKLMEDFGMDRETAMKVVKSVKEVNIHHHTKTCRKKAKEACRFKFPRLPSLHCIISQVLPLEEMEEDDYNYLKAGINYVIKMAKDQLNCYIENDEVDLESIDLDKLLLDSLPDIYCNNETITVKGILSEYKFDVEIVQNFYRNYTATSITAASSQIFLRLAVYHYCLSICDYGTRVVLERRVCEVFVNNYNPLWMDCWDANMDIQPCTDYFACITYMTDYICKPETKTTNILKAVHKEKKQEKASHKEMMYALVDVYLQSRKMGITPYGRFG